MKRKVIGVGFHKTGTSTLGKCLSLLGHNHISCSRESFLLYQTSEINSLLKIMEFFDSFEDWPWALVYKEAFERFPTAKFVLTTRLNEDVWFESIAKHVWRGAGVNEKVHESKRYNYRPYIYGDDYERLDKNLYVARYLRHNREVRDFFADKPESLLEMCWERGDEWNKLCNFLELQVPKYPFPHMNKAKKSKRELIFQRFKKATHALLKG